MELLVTIIGYLVAVMTVIMYTPQSIKVLKTKNTEGLSKITFVVLYLAYITYVIWGPLNESKKVAIPAMISNGLLIFVGWPLMYYMFIDKKYVFYTLAIMGILAILIALIWIFFDLPTTEIGATILSIIGGGIIGVIFTPQTLAVMKAKKMGNVSIIGTSLIAFGNSLWVFFYVASIVDDFTISFLIQAISCVFGVLLQTPMIYLYLKGKSSATSSILKK